MHILFLYILIFDARSAGVGCKQEWIDRVSTLQTRW